MSELDFNSSCSYLFLQVAQQCKENIYAIQTLKDFQYLDDNKDQGINVREKAKSLVALLKDDERLRNERVRALKAKERFAQSAAGIGSDTVVSIFLHLPKDSYRNGRNTPTLIFEKKRILAAKLTDLWLVLIFQN